MPSNVEEKDEMKNTIRLTALSGLLALALPLAADAQMKANEGQWRASIYGWFPSIGGSTSFPPTGATGPTINVDADTVLDALKFAFMGTLEYRKDQWGLWTDLVYVDLGGSKSGMRDVTVGPQQLPGDVTLNANLDVKAWIWTIAGTYNVIKSPEYSMDLLFGTRMIDMEEKLNYAFTGNIGPLLLPGPSGTKSLTLTNWDAIVGVKGEATFGSDRKWFVPYYLDIGTGQSKFTWQGIVGVGYAFNKTTSVVGAWRYLDYEMDSGDPIQSVNFNGPLIGVVFSW